MTVFLERLFSDILNYMLVTTYVNPTQTHSLIHVIINLSNSKRNIQEND